MAVTKEILNSHPATILKKEIAKTNLKGYSKMKKAELVDLMMKNKEKFGHIRKKGEAPASKPESKPKRTKEERDKRLKQIEEKQKKRKAEKKVKLLTKSALIEQIEDGDNKDMTRRQYYDHIVSYRNDYPELAETERQMEKLSDYSSRQINKQIFDYYKSKKGSLKGFVVKHIYGKAF